MSARSGCPVEFDGRGVYHANGKLPTDQLLLWAQTDDGEIVAFRTCDPGNYWPTVDALESALNAVEHTEAA